MRIKKVQSVHEIERELKLESLEFKLSESWQVGSPVISDATWAPQYPQPGLRIGSWHGRPDSINAAMTDWAYRQRYSFGGFNWLLGYEYELTELKIETVFTKNGQMKLHFSYKFDGNDEMGILYWPGNSTTPKIVIRDFGMFQFNRKLEKDLLNRLLKILEPQTGEYEVKSMFPVYDEMGNVTYLIKPEKVKVDEIIRTDNKIILHTESKPDKKLIMKDKYYTTFSLYLQRA